MYILSQNACLHYFLIHYFASDVLLNPSPANDDTRSALEFNGVQCPGLVCIFKKVWGIASEKLYDIVKKCLHLSLISNVSNNAMGKWTDT